MSPTRHSPKTLKSSTLRKSENQVERLGSLPCVRTLSSHFSIAKVVLFFQMSKKIALFLIFFLPPSTVLSQPVRRSNNAVVQLLTARDASGLYFNIIFLTQVFDHFRWKELGGGADAIGFQKSTVGLQPTAKSLWTHSRCAREFGFGIGLHCFVFLYC